MPMPMSRPIRVGDRSESETESETEGLAFGKGQRSLPGGRDRCRSHWVCCPRTAPFTRPWKERTDRQVLMIGRFSRGGCWVPLSRMIAPRPVLLRSGIGRAIWSRIVASPAVLLLALGVALGPSMRICACLADLLALGMWLGPSWRMCACLADLLASGKVLGPRARSCASRVLSLELGICWVPF